MKDKDKIIEITLRGKSIGEIKAKEKILDLVFNGVFKEKDAKQIILAIMS